jgi:hypothetical protein
MCGGVPPKVPYICCPFSWTKPTHRSWQGCNLDLTGVTIDGDMGFSGAVFSGGRVSFAGAMFSDGTVSFRGAMFSGGRVDFNPSHGPVPSGLLAAVGTPVPLEVHLCADWLGHCFSDHVRSQMRRVARVTVPRQM